MTARSIIQTAARIPRRFVVMALVVYRGTISRLLPPSCRFYPTCSEYASQAVERHGVFLGGALAAKRLLRCHPFHPGGLDPVPPSRREAV